MQPVDSLVPEFGGNRFNIRGCEDAVRVNISDVRDEHSFRYPIGGQDCLAGTRQIYGKPDYLPVDEQHLCRPMDVNGVN